MRTLKWFKNRIGKTIYRDLLGCPCKSCTDNGVLGVDILDEEHAYYLWIIQNDYACEGILMNYRDKK